MKRFLSSIIDVRKGEILLTVLMVLYIYLILVTYYFLKPARDSLFLSELGAQQLPVVFILIAFIVVPITTLYSRASRFFKLNQLINITTLIIIVNLFILRWLLTLQGQGWVFYTFYIWVSIYGALTTSQFWLLANAVYDAAQAKRIFVIFSLAAIIGAFSGGSVTSIIIKTFNVSTENLLYFCIAFLTICIFLGNYIWSLTRDGGAEATVTTKRKREKGKEDWGQMFRDMKASRHLLLIMGVIAMTMATASFVDYQFKLVSLDAFTDKITGQTDKESLTAFLGTFYGGLSLIGFLFQFLFSYRALKIFGVGGVILFLPVSQVIASIVMLISPGLTAGVLLRGSDGVFKYSIDKTARELLFLPVPLEVKKRSKVFIDLFIDRVFRGISGALLLLFVALNFSLRQISIVILIMLTIWIVLDILIRKEYVNAFRKALDKGEIDPGELTFKINDASTINYLIKSLDSKNVRQVVYSLSLLSEVQDEKLIRPVQPLLKHPNHEIRREAIRVLQNQEDGKFNPEMENLIFDDDPDVRIEALYYIYQNSEENRMRLVKNYLDRPEFKVQSAALGCIARYGTENEKVLIDERLVKEFLNRPGGEAEESRFLLAKALGALGDPKFRDYLIKLKNDPSSKVVKEAIASIGKIKDRTFLPQLLELLSDKEYRGNARDALSAFGEKILGTLNDYLIDPATDLSIRRNIPRVLRQIPCQTSVDILTSNLANVTPRLEFPMIRALNQLRNKHREFSFDSKDVNAALEYQVKVYYEIYEILHLYDDSGDGEENDKLQLLKRALSEKLDRTLNKIFRLLALLYPPKDIYHAYLGITSHSRTLRASAIEFLDNLLQKDVKDFLLPILDETSPKDIVLRARKLFKIEVQDKPMGLKRLIRGRDPWLKACAVFNVDLSRPSDLKGLVEEARNDPDPLVSETAALILRMRKSSAK